MNSLLNVKNGHFELFSETKFTVRNQILLFAPEVLLLLLLPGSQHHQTVMLRTFIALETLQADFVEIDVIDLDRVIRIGSPVTLRASLLLLLPLLLLPLPLLLLLFLLNVPRLDQTSVVSRSENLK